MNPDSQQQELIQRFIEAKDRYRQLDDDLEAFFRSKYADEIKNATTIEDFDKITIALIEMPFSSGKTLIFRSLLFRRDELGL